MKYKNELFLLKGNKIVCISLSNNKIKNEMSLKNSRYQYGEKLFVNDNYFAISSGLYISVINRNNNNKNININHLPPCRVKSIAILENRIYVLGSNGYYTIMFSYLLDGSDFKLHISNKRREKKNHFDKQKEIGTPKLVPDEKRQRLILVADGIWQFTPKDEKFKQIIDCSKVYHQFDPYYNSIGLKYENDMIYFNRYSSSIYSYNMNTDKLKYISTNGMNFSNKNKPRCKIKNMQVRSFLVDNNDDIWIKNSNRLLFIDLKNKKKIYPLYGVNQEYKQGMDTEKYGLCKHPDKKSIIVIGADGVFKITSP